MSSLYIVTGSISSNFEHEQSIWELVVADSAEQASRTVTKALVDSNVTEYFEVQSNELKIPGYHISVTKESTFPDDTLNNLINDCWSSVHSNQPTPREILAVAKNLPNDIQVLGATWGWSDTEVRDKMYQFIKSNVFFT